MAKRGRKPISQEVWNEVLKQISEGMDNDDACTLAGVSETTFYEHRNKNPEFSEAVKKAKKGFLKTHLDKIANADQWQSSAWILERTFPDKFKERKSLEFENGLDVIVKHAEKSNEGD